jgi:hypothetical protein
MKLIEEGEGLRIEGAGSERARIAYATEKNGHLVLTVQTADEREHSFAMNPHK